MIYDYAIYGMGPSGINLALELSRLFPNKKILCIEKENNIGGCWRVEWQNGLFTEHSPRVLIDNELPKFFKKIGLNYDEETVNAYGSDIETNYKIYKTYFDNMELYDIFKLVKSFILKDYYNKTVLEWLDENNISEKGRLMLRIICILIANSPDKLLMSEIFANSTDGFLKIKQFKDNEKWLDIVEDIIRKNKNIILLTNTELINIKNDKAILRMNNDISNLFNFNVKNHLLTLPPKALYTFLSNQDEELKNNFGDINRIKNIVEYGSYYSLGFQLHFDQEIKWNDKWCWSCFNDYNLIILPTSNYTDKFTKNKEIKTVWSCTIVDTSNVVKKRGKKIDELSKDEIIEDVLDIIKITTIIKPKYITFYDGTKKENGRWISKDNSFSLSQYGIINAKGKINNIFSIGSHNTEGITTIGKAIKNSNLFIEKYILNKNINNMKTIYFYIGVLLLFGVFMESFYGKITDLNGTYQMIVKRNLPFPELATFYAIFIQIFTIFMVYQKLVNDKNYSIRGFDLDKLGLKGLMIFTLLATYYYHNVFKNPKEIYHFFKNLSIVGGLLMLHEII
jgi:uncharacterized membrane protein YphA (DoxX/SURF4 family)